MLLLLIPVKLLLVQILSPFFERFFIFSGPRGTRPKKLEKEDPVQSEGGPKGLHADIGSLKRFRINRQAIS
jgi:hypothetical protein